MNNSLKADFLATAIGSFPYSDADYACALILRTIPEIPCWPQLPARGMQEEMCVQYTEGLPCLKIDYNQKTLYLDLSLSCHSELEAFYEKYLTDDPNHFLISKDFSAGFPALLDHIKNAKEKQFRGLKGQIVGPITLATSIRDQDKNSVIYNSTIFDVIVKTLVMKACWQLDKYARFNVPPIIFLDEPYLSSIGSAFANINRTQVVNALNEIFDAIHKRNAMAGIHCCGNTDWSMLMDTTADIISFDAYSYMDSLLLYWREVKMFLQRGGILAWGIVPTSNDIKTESRDSLIQKLSSGINTLQNKGIDRDLINENSLITPSCGTGTMDNESAEMVMVMLRDVSLKLKERIIHRR